MNNNLWYIVLALILNNALLIFAFYKAWQNNFGLHIIYCGGCGNPAMVTANTLEIESCDECHVCENCGHYVKCDTCGKQVLVRMEFDKVRFCSGIGCIEKFERLQEKEEENI